MNTPRAMLQNNIRLASKEEIEFYETLLYPLQDKVFELVQSDQFYLSGGTCLSRFYYDHRYSEDLDFFFDGYLHPKEEFEIVFREIINRIANGFKTEVTISGEYFKRGFVYRDDVVLKLEFIYESYKNVGQRQKRQGIFIDSKENIATNKLTAIYDRKTAKDFVDLYYLLQDIQLEQVAAWSEHKIVPLDYEGVLLAFADRNLEGSVLLKRDIAIPELNRFIGNLIQQMIDHAKKSQ